MQAAASRRVVWSSMVRGPFRCEVVRGGQCVEVAVGAAACAVPLEGGGERVVERRGVVAEGSPELGVVDDPAVGELVERVEVLAHRRLDQPEQAQGRAAGGEAAGSVAGEPVDVVDDLPGRPRLGDREVPDRAAGRRVGAEGDERGGHVGRVRVAVQLVGVAHDLGAADPSRAVAKTVSPSAERRGAGPEVVRRPADGDLDPSGAVRVEELVRSSPPGWPPWSRSGWPARSRRGRGRGSGRRRRGCRARRGGPRRPRPRRARRAAAAGTPRPSGRSSGRSGRSRRRRRPAVTSVVNAGSVASPPTSWRRGCWPRPLRLTATTS